MIKKRLLIIWHSRTGGSRALAAAAADGARAMAPDVLTALRRAEEVDAAMLCASDAYLFVTPENLAALSGAMKEMFDRTYYACLGQIEGRAYATIICSGSDGAGAERQLDRIVTGWRLRRVADGIIVITGAQTGEAIWTAKTIEDAALDEARALGGCLSAGLHAGII
jgi:NAD(P)H-dependent FMN reductase